MSVSSSDDIIRRAREMEMLRKLERKNTNIDVNNIKKSIDIIEMKIDRINRKIDELLSKKRSLEIKDVHNRILNLLGDWVSTENIAKMLGYSHEYVSRKISELKDMGKIEEKRIGKNLFYRKKR
ncbi:MAG: hypothetical protein J7L08_04375 [Candidatus Aenigmarchaeota archaeon]|nr:hypothetical protein [Candidatus Aenigmarchaeota archaeon]